MMFTYKTVGALTGLFLCVFLIVHLSANCILLLPEGTARELYNAYSETLRESLLIKLVAYALYASILLHLLFAVVITVKNRKARPKGYRQFNYKKNSSWVSQNMGLLGVAILLFLVVHLANFWSRIKLGLGEEVGIDPWGYLDVYQVTYNLFQKPWFVLFYSLLMIPLGFHLYHGVKSAFLTLGLYHHRVLKTISKVALVYALIMTIGFGLIPLVVYFK